jgi:hypothetical protein
MLVSGCSVFSALGLLGFFDAIFSGRGLFRCHFQHLLVVPGSSYKTTNLFTNIQ